MYFIVQVTILTQGEEGCIVPPFFPPRRFKKEFQVFQEVQETESI
jgi:hypothetical protein